MSESSVAVPEAAAAPSEGSVKYWQARAGIAPIKQEYVIWEKMRSGPYVSAADGDDEAEGRSTDARGPANRSAPPAEGSEVKEEGNEGVTEDGEPQVKKVRVSGAEKKRLAKARNEAAWQAKKAAKAAQKAEIAAEKVADAGGVADGIAVEGEAGGEGGGRVQARGQNKNRRFDHQAGVTFKLCPNTAKGQECPRQPNCRSSHDLAMYLTTRSPDIPLALPTTPDNFTPTFTPRQCPLFTSLGACPYGFKCQFSASHLKNVGEGNGFQGTGLELVMDEAKVQALEEAKGEGKGVVGEKGEMNVINMASIRQVRGQGKKADERYPLSQKYMDSIGELLDDREHGAGGSRGGGKRGADGKVKNPEKIEAVKAEEPTPEDAKATSSKMEVEPSPITAEALPTTTTLSSVSVSTLPSELPVLSAALPDTTSDTSGMPDLAPIRACEKKRLNFEGKLYLAPLTTVGNLPFRRLATQLGADITCSEMGLAQEFLNGNNNEWSLLRRHPSEKFFGVQICGSKPQVLVPTAEIIAKSCEIDFLDINCGCPIDLVFNKGGGSALLGHATKLGKALAGMSQVLGEIPLTIKIRNGIAHGTPVAHKLVTRMQGEWGTNATVLRSASAQLHGRSRQQRYKTKADYAYIGQVAQTLRETASDLGLPSIPIFGNGDAYDYRDYYANMEASGVDGIMIARGALVKPWIFTEIKERRDWDISSRERLDQIGQLATYGLEHWGSDTQGINITRRFLLESLSFQHRYVPVGLLERFPVSLNERAFPYRGRDQLEVRRLLKFARAPRIDQLCLSQTLLASDQADDWIKISNMFLGPPPDDWVFLPKHKANATAEEVQG
ncbi:tRNA-dihydrouridine synthase 3, partial [Phenoliferia sp. Uapishka_3]